MSSYVVLARRWRPRTFGALVGQGHVTQALAHALATGRVPHAFLFSGIRGVGKTTLARLLAMCLSCEGGVTPDPCGRCGSCREIIAGNHPDVFEVDAASRTKVEQMREILDGVGYSPAVSRYKIYILDEVHMLSTQSFNALLKTLEEPPPHVKFVFATTEPRKIPATILSRCQRYDLKRVSRDLLTAHLVAVLEKEEVVFDVQGLAAIVRAAEGSVRDALSLLDQVISHGAGAVKFDAVKNLLGLTDQQSVFTLLGYLLRGEGPEALRKATDFYDNGVEPESLVRELLDAVHQATRRKLFEKSTDDPLEKSFAALVVDVSLEHLQMIYQVLLRGSQDLRMAESSLQALEMLILRAAYLKPVPDLEKLVARLRNGEPSGGALPGLSSGSVKGPSSRAPVDPRASSSSPSAVPTQTVSRVSPSQHPEMQRKDSLDQAHALGQERESVDSGPCCLESFSSWEQLVSSILKNDVGLGVKLKTQISCLKFPAVLHVSSGSGRRAGPESGSPNLVLRLSRDFFGTPDYFRQLLEDYFSSHNIVGGCVAVEAVSDAPRPKTLEEVETSQRDDLQSHLLKRAKDHPLVQKMRNRFQAEIVRVEPFSEASVG